MKVLNQVLRTADDFEAFLDQEIAGRVAMVHLLRFKDRAEYSDGRDTDLTGADAFALYRQRMIEKATSVGGHLVFSASVGHLVLGEVEDLWDDILIVEFPSKEAFVETISAPELADWSVHRRAGLAGQLLIATTPDG